METPWSASAIAAVATNAKDDPIRAHITHRRSNIENRLAVGLGPYRREYDARRRLLTCTIAPEAGHVDFRCELRRAKSGDITAQRLGGRSQEHR